MIFRRVRFHSRGSRGLCRILLLVALAVLALDTHWLLVCSPLYPPINVDDPRIPEGRNDRIFIASIHWHSEKILRSHWNNAVVDLIRQIGPQNVYVSILESGSWDETKEALRELDKELEQLNVERTIVLEDVTHKDELSRIPTVDEAGFVLSPDGTRQMRRIPYLARLRNRVMSEIIEVADRYGKPFDKVLWLNDVAFKPEDIITLLSTNDGHYAAACSLDFSIPPFYYDTFALRDDKGRKTTSQAWPYFSAGASRNAILRGKSAPVRSCWNGAVAMDAAPFQQANPLQFRGIPDSLAQFHLEASECCLIHADNPLSATKGVWVNPNVRVGYSGNAYAAVHKDTQWPSKYERLIGLWKVRLGTGVAEWRSFWEVWTVRSRMGHWQTQHPSNANKEHGVQCIVNEMQVLAANGWKHM